MKGPTYETWQWRGGLATWSYSVPALPGESAKQCLERSTVEIIGNLSPFARIGKVDISTLERGEDTFQLRGPNIAIQELREALTDPAEPYVAILSLDLGVLLSSVETDTWLESAARIFLERDEQSERDQSVKMWLSLDVDIYSPVTWGISRDNTELARLNGPRLSNFLRMVREKLGASLDDMDHNSYNGHIDENGFH